ncbi:MAG: alpha-2-macroglobulin family protein [Phenylobacterium sp.]|uniref:alpha-2-macroglobulin family protein n=1 Tax=Phenylobacterium sp. TaxID=1871053 RepID=UPI001A469069|nr:alpha-2-macroglobulin [Phenylobacterium sp.]MBL8555872.1 alpha-2-macroglobulin family protein [Phenylobacterium sp.]
MSVGGGSDSEGAAPSWRDRVPGVFKRQTSLAVAGLVALAAFGGGVAATVAVNGFGRPTVAAAGDPSAGPSWGLFGKPRGADARRRGVPKPAGFAVWTSRFDVAGNEPRACIRMSQALDAARSYGDYVTVSPALANRPAVTVKGDELCVGGIGFVDRTVTLLKGLPGVGGAKLARNYEVAFASSEKPPYVGFAGLGVILPREDADGVGLETVNVSRLHIEVWRVVDRNLVRKSISAPDPTGEGEYADNYGDDTPRGEGRLIWKGDVAVRGRPGERVTTVFPLGAVLKEMQPGGYVIKAKDASGPRGLKAGGDDDGYDDDPPAQARRWVMFTDMAMTAYQGSDGLDVVVRSLKSAKTLSNLRVALVASNGEDLAETRSDASGRARFDKPLLEGKAAERAKMVMVYGPQGDLAVLDLDRAPVDLSREGIGGRNENDGGAGPVDAYIYADRGVYRPGETVRLNALLRDREARAVKERKGYIVVRRPSGVELIRYGFEKTPYGSAAASVVLPRSAPRGRWRATVEIDGVEQPAGELAFAVEDFAPQRLEVTAKGDEQVPLRGDEVRAIDVAARFLYGAAGAGLQTQGEARLRVDADPFPQFKGYQWGDQRTPFEEQFLDLETTVTDGEGRAVVHLSSAAAQGATQPLEAAVVTSVFEPGGRPVREGTTFKVRPAAYYLGARIDQGVASGGTEPVVSAEIIAVDPYGRRRAQEGVTYTLIKEAWTYDWFQQDGRWQWRRSSRDVAVQRGTLNIPAGGSARVQRRLGWGDYRLEMEGPGGAVSVIRFASGWGEPAKDVDAPDLVRVSAGIKAYRQGDTVEITLKPPYAGEAQIAVATDRIVDFKSVPMTAAGGTVRLKSTAAWGGGAYILVSVIQPRDAVSSPKPGRALGVVYVPLDPKDRKLAVDIGTPTKQHAKARLDVPLTIKGQPVGAKVRVTVAAVDEGILRLTRFQSPDPVKWYFGKRALRVDLRDDYGRLLDPNLGAPANVNFGADEIGGEGLTTTPIRTVALWSGVIETDRLGRATIHLPAPDLNGELRLMAVAWTDDAVGGASKPLTVREPVVAELNLPRFMAPGDRALATLELHNLEGKPGDYTASVAGKGGFLANLTRLFRLPLGQRTTERVAFDAPRRAGVGAVSFRVSGPGFTTARDLPIQSRLGWGRVTRTTTVLQQPGETYTPAAALLAGLAAGDATMQVSYSPFRGFDPAPIAASLSRYPYGCTEQLVSGAYPLLYGAEIDPKLRRATPALNTAVGKLLDRQSLDGAFGLWSVGDGEADPWIGAYVTDFLVEARRQGAPVSQAAMDRALFAMREISKPDGYSSLSYRMDYPGWWAATPEQSEKETRVMRRRASAYALYVLAKAGRGDLARLRWWNDVQMKDEASPLARAQVATGLALMGDRARARAAFREATAALGYKARWDWYQSPLRDLAGVIALAYEAGEPGTARALQTRLENAVKDPDALNTQEQARLLQAAHFMLAASGRPAIQASGVTQMSPAGGAPRWSVGRLIDARFLNAGKGGVWRTVTVTGAPIAAPAASASGLSVSKTMFTLRGQPVDPAAVRQGDRVIVRISGRSQQARGLPLVVDDPLPAGFEIETVLGPDDAKGGPFGFLGKLTSASAQEARDDRYVAAAQVEGNGAFAFAYVARAVTPGDFLLPGVEARDMYRPGVAARTAPRRTSIAPGA